MGNTYYVLVLGDGEDHAVPERRREEVLYWLERDEKFRHELEDFHPWGMNGHIKWHGHARDLIRLSKAFPEVLFVLWSEGEEVEDLWKCYYFGGRMQEAPARVGYPPFNPTELTDPVSSTV